MPTKLNSAGKQQNYVPAGNGDASGEYGDNATGSNKNFKTFKKPEPIKKTIYYRDDWEGKRRYISKEDYDEAKKWDLSVQTKDIEYNEDEIREQINKNIKNLLAKNPNVSWSQLYYRKLAMFDENGNSMDQDVFSAYMQEEKNRMDLYDLYKNITNESHQKELAQQEEKGKQELEKFPKIEGKINVDDNIVSVNKSNYDRTSNDYFSNPSEYKKYHQNCQKCAQSFELRMRGYNVEALERPNNRTKAYNQLEDAGWDMAMYIEPEEGFEYYGNYWFFGEKRKSYSERKEGNNLTKSTSLSQKQDIERIVKKAGNGARFQCNVAWKYGGAHVFNIINDNGNVRFIDAQSGKTDVSSYFDSGTIKPSETMIVRVDKLKINGNVSIIAKGK